MIRNGIGLCGLGALLHQPSGVSSLSLFLCAGPNGFRRFILFSNSFALGVAGRHAGPHVLLDAVLRERIAQAVFRQGRHAFDGAR